MLSVHQNLFYLFRRAACLFKLIVLCLNINICSVTRTFAQVLTLGGHWLSHERMWQPATNIQARSHDHCYHGKWILRIVSVCL